MMEYFFIAPLAVNISQQTIVLHIPHQTSISRNETARFFPRDRRLINLRTP